MIPFIEIGAISIPTYFLVISLAISISTYWAYRRSLAERFFQKFSTIMTLDLALVIFIFGGIGGRLFHVLYESPLYYMESPFRIFAIWEGGFVFFGGMISAGLAAAVYLRLKKQSFRAWADFVAAPLALSYALGRIGCFLAGCCYGKACVFPWGVHFPFEPEVARHPTQLYATIYELLVVYILLKYENKRLENIFKAPGQIFLLWLALHSAGRFVMERFREDFRGTFLFSLSISSWISIVIFVTSILLMIKTISEQSNEESQSL